MVDDILSLQRAGRASIVPDNVADLAPMARWSRHRGRVRCVTFASHGRVLASAADDRTVRLWRVSDGSLLHTLLGHSGIVHSVAFAPDGDTLASGSNDGQVRLWRLADGRLLRTLSRFWGSSAVLCVTFSPDGYTLASGSSDGQVRLWRVSDGTLLRTLPGTPLARLGLSDGIGVKNLALAPDGHLLASASPDGTVLLRSVSDGMLLATLWGRSVRDVVRKLRVHLWDLRQRGSGLAFAPGGQILASTLVSGTILLWHVISGVLLHTLRGHTGDVSSLAFAPDGRVLACGLADGSVRLWGIEP